MKKQFICEECNKGVAFEYEDDAELERLLTENEGTTTQYLCEECYERDIIVDEM